MKIAYFLPEFPKLNQPFVTGQIREMARLGHEITIYAPKAPPDAFDQHDYEELSHLWVEQPTPGASRMTRTLEGCKTVPMSLLTAPIMTVKALNPVRFGRYALSFSLLQAMKPLRSPKRFDVIHCQFGPSGVFAAMLKSIGAVSGPLITTFHGHDVTRYPLEQGKNVYDRLFEVGVRFLGLDPVMADRLKALGAPEDKVMVHPLGAIPDDFPHRDWPEPPNDSLRVLSVGRLVEKKGFADGIKAVAALRKSGVNIRYEIAGDGPLQGELEGLIDELDASDAVELLGPVDHNDISKRLEMADLALVPSVRARDGDEEGTPTVIVEAMATGRPVVATRHAGIPFQIEHGVNGLLVPEHAPDELAEAIAQFVDPEMRKQIGANGRRVYESRFCLRTLTRKLEDIYTSVAKDSEEG